MRNIRLLAATAALALAGVAAAPAPAPSTDVVSPETTTTADNPWMERRNLNIAHRGGAIEAPENTLFAYHKALEAGADMLETDVYFTADGEVVVIHDDSVDRTTDGTGRINDLTLAELKALDAAHWYAEGRGTRHDGEAHEYVYRGIATGDVEPPLVDPDCDAEAMEDELNTVGEDGTSTTIGYECARYRPEDFRIPTLREFLQTFPDELMVIELKPNATEVGQFEKAVADILREFDRTDTVTIASFIDAHTAAFQAYAPEIHTSVPTGQAAVFHTTARGPAPGSPSLHKALQVPIDFNGIEVIDGNGDFVRDAHANDLAVHVWTVNDADTMRWLLDLGVDGIMTDAPSLLAEVLAERAAAEQG